MLSKNTAFRQNTTKHNLVVFAFCGNRFLGLVFRRSKNILKIIA